MKWHSIRFWRFQKVKDQQEEKKDEELTPEQKSKLAHSADLLLNRKSKKGTESVSVSTKEGKTEPEHSTEKGDGVVIPFKYFY